MHPALKFATQIALSVLLIATSIAMIRESARIRVRPRRFVPAAGAFAVPVNRRFRLLQMANLAATALVGLGATAAVMTSDIGSRAVHTAAFVLWSFVLVLTLGMEVLFVWTYRRSPITLTPAGVRLKLRTFSWDSLDVSVPRSIPTWPLRKNTSFPEWDADPAFIAAAIDYYSRNPGARAAIGQTDEHERLQATLNSAS